MPNFHLLYTYGLKRWTVYYMGQVQVYGLPTGHFDGGWQQQSLATVLASNSAGNPGML